MPGKKPKERQRYMLRINDTLVEVTREVYLAWYQAGRKERYQVEKMQRHGVCSMEELQEKGYDCSFSVVSPEEIVDCKMFRVFFFQTFKHEVNRVLEILVVLAGFRRIYHLKQRREVLLVLRGFIPDVAD